VSAESDLVRSRPEDLAAAIRRHAFHEPESMSVYRSILVVDDDADVRETISDALSLEGHRVLGAGDGLEGLAALDRCETPVFVLLDRMMPRMDGPTFLQELGRRKSPGNVHVVLTSAQSGSLPASPFVIGELPKPFDIEALLALLSAPPRGD
jgi:DNA-binding response OmpR family regulator